MDTFVVFVDMDILMSSPNFNQPAFIRARCTYGRLFLSLWRYN